jgi:serine/threonine protein kinase
MSDENLGTERSRPTPALGLLSSPNDESLVMDSGTALAPSCPAPLNTAMSDVKPAPPALDNLTPGERIEDFEIISLLGKGAFGAVYLARQLSLDRQVALKITQWQGGEGRKMARLEHENIVQVFSETSYGTDSRLLCMQYVAGATLQEVLDLLNEVPIDERSGQKLLDAVDRLVAEPAAFDPAAIRNRELLSRLDWPETVCWIGARLAEALDFAHSRGVIHRDIKPGNIMLNQYGRPLLVDFNLAFQPLDASATGDRLGGTLAYMAPEHLEAFAPDAVFPKGTVAQAADIYSLGVVLYQAAAGKLPFSQTPPGKTKSEVLRAMASQRRELPEPLPPELPRALDQVVARCMHPDPSQRYASGRELSAALDGCRNYSSAEKSMPDFHGFRAMVMRHPGWWLLILSLIPHIVGSIINIAYNKSRIIDKLDPVQVKVFWRIVGIYDSIGYSVGILLALRIILPVVRGWRKATARLPEDREQIDKARRIATTWPWWAFTIACICWIPGGIVFPTALTLASKSISLEHWVHLIISFTLSGLIAATYSIYLVQWMTLCVTYPRLWYDRQRFRAIATAELRGVPRTLRMLQVMAGLIPLIAAILLMTWMVMLLELHKDEVDPLFGALVIGLMILGAAGFPLATHMTGLLAKALAALVGTRDESAGGIRASTLLPR